MNSPKVHKDISKFDNIYILTFTQIPPPLKSYIDYSLKDKFNLPPLVFDLNTFSYDHEFEILLNIFFILN